MLRADRDFDQGFLGMQQNRRDGHDESERLMLDSLNVRRKQMQLLYRKSLLHPEEYAGAKIPSEIPQQTATAQLKYNFNITPNSSGRFLLVIDPSVQSSYLYNDSTVDGSGNGVLTTLNFTQDSNIIDMWRLVSSSIVVQYTGRLDSTSGYFVGAISSNLSNATQTTFLTFSAIEDLQNRKVVAPIDGLKMVYSPYDTSQLDYVTHTVYSGNTNPTKWKQLFIVYGEGLPNTNCVRVDYVRNIEYVAKPSYREYIQHSMAVPAAFDSSALVEAKSKEIQTIEVY